MKTLSPLIVAFLVLLSSNGFAQDAEEKAGLLDNISISPHAGMLYSLGDFNDDPIGGFTKGSENNLGLGLLLNYRINSFFSLSAGFLSGKLSGSSDKINTLGAVNAPSDLGFGILFKTDILEFTLPRVDVNLTRLMFRDRSKLFNKLSVGIFAGAGLLSFDSKIYAQQDESVNLLYNEERGRTGETTELFFSGGLNLSYIINDRFDLGVESSLRAVDSDKLDAWVSPGSANDIYTYTAVMLTFHIKGRKEIVKSPKMLDPAQTAGEVGKVEVEEDDSAEDSKASEDKGEELSKEDARPMIVEKEEAPVLDAKEADKATDEIAAPNLDEPAVAAKDPAKSNEQYELNEEDGYFITVAAFRNKENAGKVAKQLAKKGENPMLLKNSINSWVLVAIARYDDRDEAIKAMKKARKNGYERSWVHEKVKKSTPQ